MIGAPSILKLARRAAALAKLLPIFALLLLRRFLFFSSSLSNLALDAWKVPGEQALLSVHDGRFAPKPPECMHSSATQNSGTWAAGPAADGESGVYFAPGEHAVAESRCVEVAVPPRLRHSLPRRQVREE